MTSDTDIQDSIDDYTDTIFAIVGFINFYRFDDDTKRMRGQVIVFQGRRLSPSPGRAKAPPGSKTQPVTPDFGILDGDGRGVLGDAKKSFPDDRSRWIDDFRQLMAYDDDLTGWPCASARVDQHDVVLLTHQTRAVAVCDYYEKQRAAEHVHFARPFSIVSFGRSDERQPYVFFQKRLGDLSDGALGERLRQGVPVPMDRLRDAYSTVKLYDSPPPLVYMAQLIWEHVVAQRACDDPRFAKLHRNQKLEVNLTVDEIADELHRDFSFRTLCQGHGAAERDREPHVPRRKWCVSACDALVEGGSARWTKPGSKNEVTIYFRKVDSVRDYMVEVCGKQAIAEEDELSLFAQAGLDEPDK